MFGKRKILVIVLASLVAGSIVAATTSSVAVMILARIVQGGGGAIFPLAFSIIRDELPRERVAGAIGLISASSASARASRSWPRDQSSTTSPITGCSGSRVGWR